MLNVRTLHACCSNLGSHISRSQSGAQIARKCAHTKARTQCTMHSIEVNVRAEPATALGSHAWRAHRFGLAGFSTSVRARSFREWTQPHAHREARSSTCEILRWLRFRVCVCVHVMCRRKMARFEVRERNREQEDTRAPSSAMLWWCYFNLKI